MRTCLSRIQPHPHGAILRHYLNMINSFLCSSTNYFENELLPNDLFIFRNHGDDEEDIQDIKRVLESQGNTHNKVEVQANSESKSLTVSPTRSPGPHCLQIDAHDTHDLRFGCSSYAWKAKEIRFPMQPVSWSTKIGVVCNH